MKRLQILLVIVLALAFYGCGNGNAASAPPPPPTAPAISAQPANQTVTAGATATFTVTASGSAPLTYQWNRNGTAISGATSASYSMTTAMSDSGASFTVTVTNSAGSVTSSAATLTVNAAAPAVTTHPASQAVTVGQTATFSVVATGTAPLSYQWKKNGTAIAGATSSSYTTPATVMADNGTTFTVTVTNAGGNVTSNAATLTVNAVPPAVTTQPADQTVLAGQTASFSVVATGTAPLSYQWNKNGTAIVGATASSYTTPPVAYADNSASFTVTVTNAGGSVTSNAGWLWVNAPPSITTQPSNQGTLEGQTATFSVVATGTAPFTYQWSKNGTQIVGATSSSYTTPATVLADSGATFSVTVTNAFGNVTSNAATLTVNPAPPSITTQPTGQTVLAGQTATFSVTAAGTAPLTYQWSKNGTAIVGATSSSYITPATVAGDNGATFTVTVNNVTNQPVTSTAATLTVNVPPAITVQPGDQTVTAGQTATFSVTASGTAPLTYQWSKNGTAIVGATSSSYITPATVAGDNGATFTVTVNNVTNQPVTSAAATLTVNSPPAITVQPGNQTVLEGQTATFSVTATGTAPLTYQWSKNGTAIVGATNSSYTTPATAFADNGASFTVTVTNIASSVTSNAATLTVNAPPSITSQPVGQSVLDGQTASFSVTATGTAPFTYQWSKNGTVIPGASASAYTTPAVVMTDNGATFTVTVTNAYGNVTSGAATLTVGPAPPAITTQPTNQTVTDGQTATFSLTATGTAPLTYQWFKNGVLIGGASSSTYTTPATVIGDNGATFTASIANGAGNVTSSAATLTVNPAPPVFTTQPASQTVNEGQTATFTAALTGTAPLTYQWSKNGTAIPGATSSSYTTPATVIGDNGAIFTVFVTNAAGNVTSSAATLTVNAPPVITGHPGNQTVTEGQTASFSVTATGTAPLTYAWSKNGTAIPGATSSSYTTPATAMTDSGATFTVTVTNAFGNATSNAATLTVNAAPPSITTQPANQSVLAGQTATFSVTATGTAPLTYAWSKNGTPIPGATSSSYTTPATVLGDNNSSFTVTVTNTAGNVTSNAATLTVNAAPSITGQPGNQAVLEGQTATFSVTATGTAPLTYAWSKNGTAIPGATSSSYTTPATVMADNGATFTVTVTNAFGNATSNAATLTVNPVPPSITTQPADQTVYVSQTATFNVIATGTAPLSYQWKRGGVDIPGANGSTYVTPAAVIGDNGATFTVTITNGGGNVTSNVATLTVNPLPPAPTITQQPADQTVMAGQTATFNVVATGTGPLSYQWTKNGTPIPGANGTTYITPPTDISDNGAMFRVEVTNLGGTTTSNPAALTVTPNAFTVSGNVNTINGGPGGIAGVTVSIDTTPVQTTTTDGSGNFSFTNVPNGTYTVTPSITGPSSVFYPTSRSVTVNGGSATANFQAALGYTVSGTVSYPSGVKTGRVYISLMGTGGYGFGTSIAAPGAFTIRGVPPGTYVLQAWRDNLGSGVRNASNPSGTSVGQITVTNANVPGTSVTMNDPAAVNLTGLAPQFEMASGMDQGVILQVRPIKDMTQIEMPTSYEIQWSTVANFSSLAGSTTMPATGGNEPYILHGLGGLTNGTSLYFRARGVAGASTSNWVTTPTALPIGTPPGANLISGNVTFSGSATGPLYVGFFDQSTGTVYAQVITNPISPQPYTISVPNGSNYFFFGIIDQNNDGVIGAGDISNTDQGGNAGMAISGPMTNVDLTLSSANSTATVATSHSRTQGQADNWYGLDIQVRAGIKRAVAVALLSGPNVVAPMDVALQSGRAGRFQFWLNLGNVRPTVGDTYALELTYTDGTTETTETLNPAVTAVLDDFATALSPAGSAPGQTTPTFIWNYPANNASSYLYTFQLQDSNWTDIWYFPQNSEGFPSTIPASITWGVDPTGGNSSPSVGSLTLGATYQWSIRARDANGNSTSKQTSFTP